MALYINNFSDANLYDVRFAKDSDITEANFQNANIDCGYSLLYECDAAGVNFESATLEPVTLVRAILITLFFQMLFSRNFKYCFSDIQDTCFDGC